MSRHRMPESSVGMADKPQIVEHLPIGAKSPAEPSLQVTDALLRIRSLAAVLARQAAREDDAAEREAGGAIASASSAISREPEAIANSDNSRSGPEHGSELK